MESTVTAPRLVPPVPERRWLLLLHQLPAKPSALRVKVWRRLQGLGAVSVKGSVYLLPETAQAREDLEWLVREIALSGGEAAICEARFVEGMRDEQIESLFSAAREADYRALATEARALAARFVARGGRSVARSAEGAAGLARLQKRYSEVLAIDFFGATGRESALGRLAELERRLAPAAARASRVGMRQDPAAYRARTWVTRRGVHVDRIASAWLIRRFIDPAARFKFVSGRGYQPLPGEVRFDMFDAEFTHDGDLCTFEVLVARFGLQDCALRPIAEIVHDIDLKDEKFGRTEVAGMDRMIAGLAMAHADDEERLSRGAALLDDLHTYYTRKRVGAAG